MEDEEQVGGKTYRDLFHGNGTEYGTKWDHGRRSNRRHGTERNIRKRGSVREVENEVAGTLFCHGDGTEATLRSHGSVAALTPSMVAEWK